MRDWPHAPLHRLSEAGVYMVTGATYLKAPHFAGAERLHCLHGNLLRLASELGWRLQAWAVFANHYHFIAPSPEDATMLRPFISKLHTLTATEVNRLDGTPGRRVWYQYWDSLITIQSPYLARLAYVHNNPVKHGLVDVASAYRWCSAGWFERTASPTFQKTLAGFKTDRLNVMDSF